MALPEARAAGLARFPAGTPRVALFCILVAAAALRVGALHKPLYIDEIVTITVASQPLARMAETMREVDASPALFPLLLRAWMAAGRSDVWVRLLPALLGIGAVAVVAVLACRMFGWRAGLAAAFVMAIAPAHVHYAQYVRGYSLLTLLAALHVWLCYEWLQAPAGSTWRRWLAAVLLTAALLYTHYLALLLLAGEAAAGLWWLRDARRRVLLWGAALAAGGLLFLPGVPLLLHNVEFDRLRNADRPERPPLARLVPDLALELAVGQRPLGFSDPAVRRATLAAAAVVFPAVWLTGLFRAARERPAAALLVCAVSVLPMAVYLLSGRKLVAVRFFVPFAACAVVLMGVGLASMRPKVRTGAAVLLLLLSAVPLWHFYGTFAWSYDHRRVAQAIAERSRAGDVILVTHPFEAFYYRWYLGSRLPIHGLLFTPLDEQDSYVIKPPPIRFEQARARVLDASSRFSRIWIVGQSRRSFASDAAEEAKVLAWMDQAYARVDDLGSLTGSDPVIRLYEARPRGAAPGR